MKKKTYSEDEVFQYITSMLEVKRYRLKLVILNRYHKNNRYISEFSFVCKDTTGKTHIDTGITLFNADYIFLLLSLQNRFPDCGLIDLTADKDKPVFNSIPVDNIDTVINKTQNRKEKQNDLQTDSAT